jgi:hypothetical protein
VTPIPSSAPKSPRPKESCYVSRCGRGVTRHITRRALRCAHMRVQLYCSMRLLLLCAAGEQQLLYEL